MTLLRLRLVRLCGFQAYFYQFDPPLGCMEPWPHARGNAGTYFAVVKTGQTVRRKGGHISSKFVVIGLVLAGTSRRPPRGLLPWAAGSQQKVIADIGGYRLEFMLLKIINRFWILGV